jgi:hypothetical protein
MRPTPLTFGLLIAVHMASSSSSARADGAVMIAGKISPRERDIIVDSLALTATSMTWKLSAPPFSRGAIDASLACLKDPSPWACVAPGLRGNDQLVIVQVDSDRGIGAPTTVVTAHVLTAGTDGELLASRYCEVDNEDALRRAVADLSKQLLQEAAERTGRTKLAIHSKPDKAWILLDGKTVGATNTTRVTYPGTHTIMLRQVNSARSMAMAAADSHSLQHRLISRTMSSRRTAASSRYMEACSSTSSAAAPTGSRSTPSRKTEATPASRRA